MVISEKNQNWLKLLINLTVSPGFVTGGGGAGFEGGGALINIISFKLSLNLPESGVFLILSTLSFKFLSTGVALLADDDKAFELCSVNAHEQIELYDEQPIEMIER